MSAPAKPTACAAERIDGVDDFGIDFARQNVVHDFHRGFVGDALALDEIRLSSPAFSIARVMALPPPWTTTGLISTASRKTMSRATPLRMFVVRRVHETAAVFDDERLAAEFLDVRQRFEQRLGFGDQILHAVFVKEFAAK